MPPSPLTTAILLALARGEHNAYAIVQQIKFDTRGLAHFNERTTYYALERLLAKGLIAEAPRSTTELHIYQLSERGRRVLRAEFVRLQEVIALLRDRTR